jgi:hypothetical protein
MSQTNSSENLSDNGLKLTTFLSFIFVLFVFVTLAGGLPFFLFGKVVRPDEIGLRQSYFGIPFLIKEGFQPEGLSPGLHWQLPFVSVVHILPKDLLVVNFSEKSLNGDLDLPSLEIPTGEGAKMKVDATLILRYYSSADAVNNEQVVSSTSQRDSENVPIASKKKWSHEGPSALVNALGFVPEAQLRFVATSAQGVMKDTLGLLSTAEFYDPTLREEAAFRAFSALNEELSKKGIEIWAVLVRRYQYPQAIDDRIFEKNLELQKRKYARALADVLEIEKGTTELEAKLRQEIEDSRQSASSKVAVLHSEGTLFEGQKRAEGDFLVNSVDAIVYQEKLKALQNESGSRMLTALEALPMIESLKGGVVSGISPYDVDNWLQRLSGISNTKIERQP